MKRNYRKNKESKIKNIILENIMENARSYLILLVIFFIGIILGVIFVNNAKEAQSLQISSYLNNFVESVKENYQISRSKLLMKSILNNLYITIILWFLGSTVIGFPLIYVVIGYKGYSIGYTISSIIATLGTGKGLIFIISTMLFQSIIYIPAILALSVSGIKLYKLIMADRRRENIKIQILKHTIFSIFIFIILIISSFVGFSGKDFCATSASDNVLKECRYSCFAGKAPINCSDRERTSKSP